jgi:hypothetical protein
MSRMNPPQPAPAQPKLPGVIDTLSTGYRTLNKHLYLLLVPVILDLFYWLGPRLSVRELAQQTLQAMDRATASPALSVTTEQAAQSLEMLKGTIEGLGNGLNLFSLLSTALSIPSLLTSQDMQAPAWLGVVVERSITTGTELLGLAGLLFVLGVAVGAVYLGLAAQVARDGQVILSIVAQRVMSYAVRYVGLVLMLVILLIFVGLPASLIIGLVALLSPLVGSVLIMLVWAGFLWLFVNLFFTVDALFISEVGPLQAVLSSITVVRLSTSSAMGLFLITMVISLGMSYVWSALGTSEIATLVGIAGNAYIGTGMTLAGMTFYRDRINLVLKAKEARPAS